MVRKVLAEDERAQVVPDSPRTLGDILHERVYNIPAGRIIDDSRPPGLINTPASTRVVSNLPVGLRRGGGGPRVTTMPRVPTMVSGAPTLRTPGFNPSASIRREPLYTLQKEIPVTVSTPIPRPPVIRSPVPTAGAGLPRTTPPQINGRPDMGAVTDLIGSLGGAYINAAFTPTAATGPEMGLSPLNPGMLNTLGVPFVDVIPEANACAKGMVWNPAANCGAGKWQKRSRRRRKRLATRGDLSDLAALKGVLGQGKAFEVWIATHGR